jgi:hypothetical protein
MAWRARTNRTEFKSEDLSICGHIGIFFSGHRPGANCLRSVKRLPELETECFHELQSLAAQNSGRSVFQATPPRTLFNRNARENQPQLFS